MAIALPTRGRRPPGGEMTLVEHLSELRRRLFVSLLAIAAGAVVAFVLYEPILRFLQRPYCDVQTGRTCDFLVTNPLDPFALRLQIATYVGLIVAGPVVFWQLWRFVAPGLTGRERRYAVPFLVSTVVLFACGAAVAYLTFPKALEFLVGIGGPNLDVRLNPTKYLSLVSLLILAFGLSFEFPVFLVFLELVGVVRSAQLRAARRWAAIGITVFAAVITPSQDPYSMLAMAGPMYLFYEVSILIGRALKK